MPEASEADVAVFAGWRRNGSFDTEIAADAYQMKSAKAERDAREEITDSEYDDIVGNKNSGKSEEHAQLREAEALLIAYYALPSLNLRLTKKGGLQRRTGTVDNENDLMSHSEMDAYRDGWYEEAMDIFDDLSPESSDVRDVVFAM